MVDVTFRADRWLPRAAALVCLLAGLAAPCAARAASDPAAVRYASEMMDALGGQAAWDSLGVVRFAFVVTKGDTVLTSRTHYWDKRHGRNRVEGTNRAGQRYCVVTDIATRQGHAWVDGVAQAGADSASWADRGFALWTNDSYWLCMPYKLRDPGVTLHDDGDTLEVGVRYHRVRLTFDHVGLTPGDTYWAYINAASHVMEKWRYVLEGPDHDEGLWWWDDWKQVGPIRLAPMRRDGHGGPRRIEFRDLAYLGTLPASAWSSPAPVAAP